jgi:hypothetical protein
MTAGGKRIAASVVVLLSACVVDDPLARTPLLPAGLVADEVRFGDEVGPLLADRCGEAACHGRPERPFALYAAGARRMDAADTHRKTDLTPPEKHANYRSVLGFVDHPKPRDTTLLKKAIGELGHGGKKVFEAASDPAAVAVAAWLAGKETR